MTVEPEGHIFCTGTDGAWVVDPGGAHLGTIQTPERAANCTRGDPDLKSLYITETTSVYRIRLRGPGR